MVARGPAGAASSRSFRFLENTEMASASARSLSRASRSASSALAIRAFHASLAVSASHLSAGRPRSAMPNATMILAFGGMRLAVLVRHVEVEVEHALVAAAQHGERAVRGNVPDLLAEVEIVGELGALLGLVLRDLGGEHALAPFPLAQGADQGRLLGHALDQDVAGAVERGLGIGDAFFRIDELCRFGVGQQRGVAEKRVGERLETGLARDLRLGAALGLDRARKGPPARPWFPRH